MLLVAVGVAISQPQVVDALNHSLDKASSSRAGLAERGSETFGSHPVAGVGLGGFGAATGKTDFEKRHIAPHNIVVDVASELGIVGIGLFLALLTTVAVALRRVPSVTLRAILAADLVALLVQGAATTSSSRTRRSGASPRSPARVRCDPFRRSRPSGAGRDTDVLPRGGDTLRWRVVLVAAAVVLLAGGVAGAWYYHDQTETKNVRGSSTVEFDATEEPVGETAPPATSTATGPVDGRSRPGRCTATSRAHTRRDVPRPATAFKQLWERDTSLIEVPPVAANGKVFVAESRGPSTPPTARPARSSGSTSSSAARRIARLRRRGRLPRLHGHPLQARAGAKGLVVAMDSETGKVKWRANTEVIESSLLYVKGSLYFGGWDGQIVSLDAATGKKQWSFGADSGVTSSVAYHGGTLFVGADAGSFYALDASSGKLRWKSGAFSKFGKREYFYATPAVAYGRVYAPNTDGYVYSFGEKTGKLRWARRVGTYVYSAPAIWKKRVYVGTYDGFLVAMDAATGDVKWKYAAPAAVHGAPSIVDGVIYFSTLKGQHSGAARFVKNGPGRTFGIDRPRQGHLATQRGPLHPDHRRRPARLLHRVRPPLRARAETVKSSARRWSSAPLGRWWH